MAELVYTRVSTDAQSTQRQTHLLAEAGLAVGADGVRLFADPATSSKIPALEREGFGELAGHARPGDRLTVSELYRLCRDLADILTVRAWCRTHEVKLRVLSGALSGVVDLAAADASTTMLVNVLVSVGQFSARPAERTHPRGPGRSLGQRRPLRAPPPTGPARRHRPGPPSLPRRGQHRRPGPRPPRQPGRRPHRRS